MSAVWLNLLRHDVETFARRLTETAAQSDENSKDANYWFLGASDRTDLDRSPSNFMVGSIVDDLMILGTLQQGAAPASIHLEAMASILLNLAAREEQA